VGGQTLVKSTAPPPSHLHSEECCPHLSPHERADISEGFGDDVVSGGEDYMQLP